MFFTEHRDIGDKKLRASPLVDNNYISQSERRAGSHADVLDRFQNSFDTIKHMYRNEQEYLSSALLEKKVLSYWPDRWCRSFKRHCIKSFSFLMARETEVPNDARIIVFHGKPDPHEAMAGESGKWYRYFKPASWIGDYWH